MPRGGAGIWFVPMPGCPKWCTPPPSERSRNTVLAFGGEPVQAPFRLRAKIACVSVGEDRAVGGDSHGVPAPVLLCVPSPRVGGLDPRKVRAGVMNPHTAPWTALQDAKFNTEVLNRQLLWGFQQFSILQTGIKLWKDVNYIEITQKSQTLLLFCAVHLRSLVRPGL